VDDHHAGRRDYSAPLWTLLMFDGFLRHHEESSAAETVLERGAA
jgi:asparagine synthase (glutamine-hydrolysing)